MVCLLAEAPLGDDYSLWILAQTSMSQLTVQQSYLLCWELLPDRNHKSMGLWYCELMSHPDPAVLPVGTLHSLEWFWVSRRIFVYSHRNTMVFFSETSVRHQVCPRDNSSPIQVRITKFGPKMQNTLVKIPIVLGAINLNCQGQI